MTCSPERSPMFGPRNKSFFPLHRKRSRFDAQMSFMARRELRAYGAIVLYRRIGERSHLLELDWARIASRRRWTEIIGIVEALQDAEQRQPATATTVDVRTTIDLTDGASPAAVRASDDGPASEPRHREA